MSNYKAFVDNKSNVTQDINFVFHTPENIVGKGENADNQNVSKCFFLWGIKCCHYAVKGLVAMVL